MDDNPIKGLDDYLSFSKVEKTETERYVFDFEYGGWMIICYEDGREVRSFLCDEHRKSDAAAYVSVFLQDGGNEYCYKLPSYDYVADIEVYELPNEPIEGLDDYLTLSNRKNENDKRQAQIDAKQPIVDPSIFDHLERSRRP